MIAVRLHTYWNAKRISAELRRREIAQVGQWWIERLFDDLGTARPSGPHERGPRYERSSPNSLWHIDIKGPFFIQLARGRYLKTWLFGLVDDHSRYVLGLRIETEQKAAPILRWLADCIELCGKPLDLMSDNGSPFVVWMPGVADPVRKDLARPGDPAHPDPGQLALDEREDRVVLGDAQERGARPGGLPLHRGRRGRA